MRAAGLERGLARVTEIEHRVIEQKQHRKFALEGLNGEALTISAEPLRLLHHLVNTVATISTLRGAKTKKPAVWETAG